MTVHDDRRAEVAVIGAGPAGMAAAARLAEAGQRPVVFDLAGSPGGQIYRQIVDPQVDGATLGEEYLHGYAVLERFSCARIDYRPRSRVWWGERERETSGVSLGVIENGRSQRWSVDKLLLATGAMERGWPFPGWQLPGVMNAGSAQILLKQGGLVSGSAPVLAGCGPLLYLLAWQYLRVGCPPRLILDTTPAARYALPLRRPLRAWHGRGYLLKGLRMMGALMRAGVPVVRGVEAVVAEGRDSVARVGFCKSGTWRHQETELLLTHFGVVPELQLARAMGLPHRWHRGQQGLVPERDAKLSADGIWVAGDAGGIGGAVNAEREGQLAALAVLESDADPSLRVRLDAERSVLLKRRRRDLTARTLLADMFQPPPDWLASQPDTTLICRCESVDLGELRQAMAEGATGPNQLKAFTRCGMGACQGRQCGESAIRLLSRHLGVAPEWVGSHQVRPPVQAITLGELAGNATTEETS